MSAKQIQAWQERYADKVTTAEEAVASVRHGQRVFIGSGAGEPQTLVEALSARGDLSDTELVHILTLGVAPYAEPRFGSRFRHNAYFIGPNVREAVAQGRADYTPIFLSEIPRLFQSGRVVIDVALIAVSEPDEHGYPVESELEEGAYRLTIPFTRRKPARSRGRKTTCPANHGSATDA